MCTLRWGDQQEVTVVCHVRTWVSDFQPVLQV